MANETLNLNEIKITHPGDDGYSYTHSGLPEVFGDGIITVCGSSSYSNVIEDACIILANEGWMVFKPWPIIYDDVGGVEDYHRMFCKQIDKSDALLVVDCSADIFFKAIDQNKTYIGKDTKREMLYADISHKPIFLLSDTFIRFNRYRGVLRNCR